MPGPRVLHRTNAYLNNRLEQGHRSIKGPIRCMRGFKNHESAERFCREHVSMANSAIYSVLAAVLTRSSPPPSAARASSKVPALRSTSCKPLEGSGAVNQRPRLVARQLTDPVEHPGLAEQRRGAIVQVVLQPGQAFGFADPCQAAAH